MELRKRAGAWLQERRKAAGLSQIELAQRLGLKYYTFISQVENGFGRVPSDSMEAWARALGIAPADVRARAARLLRAGTSQAAVRGEGMSVIDFPRTAREWRPDELQQLVSLADAGAVLLGDRRDRARRARSSM